MSLTGSAETLYLLIAVFSASFAALGVLGTQWYNRLAARRAANASAREAEAAASQRNREDDILSDRINRLVQEEADKRIAVLNTNFELKMAESELEHQKQLTAVRIEFESKMREQSRKIGALEQALRTRGCDVLNCPNRRESDTAIKVGGTDTE